MRCLALRASAILVVGAGLCVCQTDGQKLADQARSLPPEFAVDLLFRLLDGGRITGVDANREVLESIQPLAAAVQNRMPVDDVVGWSDTEPWDVSRASALKLDALSIQCRVVKHMLGLDPQRARQMFLDIALPPVEQPKCDAALVADPAIYYDTARELADRGLLSLEAPLRGISCAMQLSPAANAMRLLRATNEQRQFLLDIYSGRLAEISDSNRSAAFALRTLPAALANLGEDLRKQGISVDALLGGYRKFLVKQATAEQCADARLQFAIDSFNDRLRWGGYLASQDLPRITEEEAKPSAIGGRVRPDRYWRTEQAKRMLSAIRHVRFGDGSTPLTADQKAADAWQTEGRALLTSLEAWKADQEPSASDSFHERAILYSSLLELLPPGTLHEAAAQSAIAFLSDSSMKARSPLQWLLELTNLLSLKQAEIARAMLVSKDPVIALYGKVTARE